MMVGDTFIKNSKSIALNQVHGIQHVRPRKSIYALRIRTVKLRSIFGRCI